MKFNINFNKLGLYVTTAFLLCTGINVQAETVFEGYYKLLSGGVPVGYIIQRYEYFKDKKTFKSRYFLKTNSLGGDITESLVAEANQAFQPISYQYTGKVGKKLTSIDATFKKGIMKAAVSDGKTARSVTKKIPKKTFLSTFLGYLMLNKGYSLGKKFVYSAIAEEEGEAYNGQVLISSEKVIKGIKTFKLLNQFKNVKFIAYVSNKAEVIKTKSPLQQLATELVAQPALATKGFIVPQKILRKIFGDIPVGIKNPLRTKSKAK